MLKFDMSNIYSPRHACGPQDRKKFNNRRIQAAVGHGKIHKVYCLLLKLKRQLTALFRMRKLDMGNRYSPRQASWPRERKKINNPSN